MNLNLTFILLRILAFFRSYDVTSFLEDRIFTTYFRFLFKL